MFKKEVIEAAIFSCSHFCLTFDVAAAGYLARLLKSGRLRTARY